MSCGIFTLDGYYNLINSEEMRNMEESGGLDIINHFQSILCVVRKYFVGTRVSLNWMCFNSP